MRIDQATVLIGMSRLALAQREGGVAEQHARAALQGTQELGLALEQQMAWNALGRAQLQQGDQEAAQSFQMVLGMPANQRIPMEVVNAQVGLAQVSLARGQIGEARAYADLVLAWLDDQPGIGLADPIDAYLTCYRVLAARGDPDAARVLKAGYQELQRRAATIGDPARRQVYLEHVRSNRELLAAQAAFGKGDQK